MPGGYPFVNAGHDPGDNPLVDVKETLAPGVYQITAPVTTNVAFNLGSQKAGNKLVAISIVNGSASAMTAASLRDGTVVLPVDLGTLPTLAPGARWTWTPPGGCLESKTGWQMVLANAGTMANIQVLFVMSE